MRKITVLWFFLSLLIFLMYTAYGNKLTAEEHSEKKPKVKYGTIMGSSQAGNRRTYPGLHVVKHSTTIRRARAIYGGANDIRHPRGKNSANSLSIKQTSLFMAALGHVIFGVLLVVCFF